MSDGERGRLNSTRSLLCFNSGNRDSSLDTCRFLELPLGFLAELLLPLTMVKIEK